MTTRRETYLPNVYMTDSPSICILVCSIPVSLLTHWSSRFIKHAIMIDAENLASVIGISCKPFIVNLCAVISTSPAHNIIYKHLDSIKRIGLSGI